MFVAFVPRWAVAHAIGLSRGEYRTLPDGVEARLVFDRAELGALLQGGPGDAPDAAAVFTAEAARATFERRLVQRVTVREQTGKACPGQLADVIPSDDAGITLVARYRCGAAPDTSTVDVAFWDALTPGHRHLVVTPSDAAGSDRSAGNPSAGNPSAGNTTQQIVYEHAPRFALAAATRGDAPSLLGWVTLGIEHILSGYDHLLFLLALVIVMPVARTLLATVSVFTLAHSITLALATFRVVAPPSGWIECAIALSIVYVGLENLTPRAARPRFAIVFAFGLIHGFGFAGALAELGLPAAQTPAALLSFNAGVELGQLAVLAVVFPLVQQCRRTPWFVPRAVPALSLATALAGAVWFFERV
ncbi:MAG TPA: HupE/UreJ family protein [Polyangiaceae bacterium]|nr:HupE/UreJ family protein [Polyangiaceae bacterium]